MAAVSQKLRATVPPAAPRPSQVDQVAVVGTALACAADPGGALTAAELSAICRSACVALHRLAGELDQA